ncbi:hypothetical protein [Paenibacillus alvei]|uniref:Uncharacterized protein n=1 Tax=Paenibacillus alvei TaxID=44250 RepID=A0A383R7G4_PAEAL|nr:hypothetical protein [Paenibacillus alvei]SYX83087.1 conserved protein of unknown function [Paenibacillus alvei]
MPSYFSIEMTFPYKALNNTFVREFYSILFNTFPYKSGYWNSENNTLEEITTWNQKHLENKFILGCDEHVNNNYKQILLLSNSHSEIRHFWRYRKNEIHSSLIIPEIDVLVEEDKWRFKAESFEQIKDLCKHIWEISSVYTLQSCLELDGGPIDTNIIKKGEPPSINPISIINQETFEKIKRLKETLEITKIGRQGVMIVDKELIE